jgi:UPF0271 protein
MRVDLNADMGESYGRWTLGDDRSLMPHLTSANIACGFHGGDPHVMRVTVALAVEDGVGSGAHVGLPDLIGFGRRRMAIAPDELRDYVLYQSGAMKAYAEAAGARLQHVKPHGALYTMIVDEAELGAAVCEAVAALGPDVALLMPPEVGAAAAAAGVPFVPEGYVDLDYDSSGKLVLERVKSSASSRFATRSRWPRRRSASSVSGRSGRSTEPTWSSRSRASASTATRRTLPRSPPRSGGRSRRRAPRSCRSRSFAPERA